MKLSGNSRNGKHVQSHSGGGKSKQSGQDIEKYNRTPPEARNVSRNMRGAAYDNRVRQENQGAYRERKVPPNQSGQRYRQPAEDEYAYSKRKNTVKDDAEHQQKKKSGSKRVVIVVLAIVIMLVVAFLVLWKLGVRSPRINTAKRPNMDTNTSANGTSPAPADVRNGDKYTFLLLGMDDGNGNTDTMMVATFDTSTYKLNVVSIPRDTMVNVDWYVKKANTLYAYGGVEGVIDGVADIIGYEVDFYFIVNLDAFEELVDAVGGVEFDVPQDMDYEDPAQDLYIHLSKGVQTLNGSDAIGVVRYRSGYDDADIGRIRTQQDFLKSAAMQIIQKKDSIKITSLAEIFLKYVKTNLNIGNLIWLAQEFFKMDAENISFEMIPGNTGDEVDGISFVSIYVDEWLKMLNEKLNPYESAIKASDLSILTRDSSGSLYVTDGVYKGDSDWGYGSTGSYNPGSSGQEPGYYEPEPSYNPYPSENPEPSPSENPEPSPSENPEPSPSENPEPSPSEDPEPSPSEDPEPSPSEDPEPSPSEDPPPDGGDGGSEESGGSGDEG